MNENGGGGGCMYWENDGSDAELFNLIRPAAGNNVLFAQKKSITGVGT